jgi:hypothetical protein
VSYVLCALYLRTVYYVLHSPPSEFSPPAQASTWRTANNFHTERFHSADKVSRSASRHTVVFITGRDLPRPSAWYCRRPGWAMALAGIVFAACRQSPPLRILRRQFDEPLARKSRINTAPVSRDRARPRLCARTLLAKWIGISLFPNFLPEDQGDMDFIDHCQTVAYAVLCAVHGGVHQKSLLITLEEARPS